jgi:hypothetical protein
MSVVPPRVSIRRTVTIDVEGSPPWKVPPDLICNIEGEEFVKLPAYNTSVVRMFYGKKLGKNASLSQSNGLATLRNIRNEKQKEVFQESSEVSGAAAVFGAGNVRAKKHKLSNAESKELRDKLVAITFTIPDCDCEATVARPVHPADVFIVKIGGDSIANMVGYVRHVDGGGPPIAKRSYTQNVRDDDEQPARWRMGMGRIVVAANDGDKRFRYVKGESRDACDESGADVASEEQREVAHDEGSMI